MTQPYQELISGLGILLQHSMIYFFHHYELPSILQRSGVDARDGAQSSESMNSEQAGPVPGRNERPFHTQTVRLNAGGQNITLQATGVPRVALIRTVYIGSLLSATATLNAAAAQQQSQHSQPAEQAADTASESPGTDSGRSAHEQEPSDVQEPEVIGVDSPGHPQKDAQTEPQKDSRKDASKPRTESTSSNDLKSDQAPRSESPSGASGNGV